MRRTGLYASCVLGKVHLVLRGKGGVLQDVSAYGPRHQDPNASIRAFLSAVGPREPLSHCHAVNRTGYHDQRDSQ